MPTESDYRIAASGVAMQTVGLSAIDAHFREVNSNPGIEGGTAGPAILEAIAVNIEDLASTRRLLAALEDELLRRAELCARYADDWADWRRQHSRWRHELNELRSSPAAASPAGPPRSEPRPPAPPFPEAEIG